MSYRRVMSRSWRLRAETWEKPRGPIKPRKESQPNGTIPTDTAGTSKTGGLLKTFWIATLFCITFTVFFFCYIRIMYWLSAVKWSQTRCQFWSPSSLKVADLRSLLNERGIDDLSYLSKPELEEAVWETGGLMEIEIKVFLEVNDNSHQKNALRFETWKKLDEGIRQIPVGVYLVLCSTELERKASELKRWRQFLHRLSKHGIKSVFVICDIDGDCDSPKVLLLIISNPISYKNWRQYPYTGALEPSDILQWITEIVSRNVFRFNNASDVIDELQDIVLAGHSAFAHSTRPLPLSYAVLASEFSGRVTFYWVETLDRFVPYRTSVMFVRPGGSFVAYHDTPFLNQREIRYVLMLSTLHPVDLIDFIFALLSVVALTIPLIAGGSFWQRMKAMLWFLLLCALASGLLAALEDRYNKDYLDALRFLATSLAELIEPFQRDLLLVFHLFDEYPWINLVVPVVYVLVAVYSSRVYQFFRSDVLAFIIRLYTSSSRSSEFPTATPVTPVSTTTSNKVGVAGTRVHIISDATKATTKVPIDAANTTAKIANNVTKTATHLPSDATMEADGADGRNNSHTNDPSTSNRMVMTVTKNRSLERQNLSLSAGTNPQDSDVLPSPSNGTTRACSTTRPFEYPPLMDSANGVLDRATAEQMTRLNIPRVWLNPIISDVELKLAVLALQKSEARDQRSFEPASRIVPCCFYCGTDFRPTSGVIVLPCRDIFHPGCVDEWMKAGNIDCPLCQMPIYATMSRTIA